MTTKDYNVNDREKGVAERLNITVMHELYAEGCKYVLCSDCPFRGHDEFCRILLKHMECIS